MGERTYTARPQEPPPLYIASCTPQRTRTRQVGGQRRALPVHSPHVVHAREEAPAAGRPTWVGVIVVMEMRDRLLPNHQTWSSVTVPSCSCIPSIRPRTHPPTRPRRGRRWHTPSAPQVQPPQLLQHALAGLVPGRPLCRSRGGGGGGGRDHHRVQQRRSGILLLLGSAARAEVDADHGGEGVVGEVAPAAQEGPHDSRAQRAGPAHNDGGHPVAGGCGMN